MANLSAVRLSVIIPAYNEELRLPNTLDQSIDFVKAQTYRSEIIVVDDGSTDGTAEVVKNHASPSLDIKLLHHADRGNHGKGASVRKGMMEARGEFRLFMDADNSTTLSQVDRFWPYFQRGCDVVIGSRALRDSVIGVRQPRYKEIAGRLGNWFIRTLAVPGIQDTQAGFKMFTEKAANIIFPRQTIDRWGYDIELLAIARAHQCRIVEIPITWINAEGSKVTLGSYVQVVGDVLRVRRNSKAGLYK
jgi:dolichyl-phosphate beta-glucosyltransferase